MKFKKASYRFLIYFISIIFLFNFINLKIVKAYINIPLFHSTKVLYTNDEVKQHIQNVFNTRSSMFINGEVSSLSSYYDISQKYGQWALEHEIKRIKYLRDWSTERGIKFTNIQCLPEIKKITPNGQKIKIRVDESYKFEYIYTGDVEPATNVFGVNLFHIMELMKKNDKWIIYKDWYLDCFEDGLKAYNSDIKDTKLSTHKKQIYNFLPCPGKPMSEFQVQKGKYNRLQAVKYADKYCGVPWASGSDVKYNKRYKNFTGIGGNCTNYISQCLGDTEGGGLRQDGGWYCVYKSYDGAECSKAWVNADAFKNYLLYSGKGNVIKKGSFKTVVTPLIDSPCGSISKLQIGDVISYAKKNDIDHNAIVTAFDSHGYPLINSHTVDRYHVPFDLGWGDKDIGFYLIHMK